MPRPINKSQVTLLICLSLVAVTLAVYWQVFHFEFLMYDDPDYVTANSHVQGGLTAANIAWAFTTNMARNWHPLTWLSHMLDWQIYGAHSGGHHATNLLFHIANTLLLFLLLRRMTGTMWRSAAVAALFALHPIHVESVAWVSERKDVLSTFFGLLTIWAYVRYTEKRLPGRYLAVLLLFACSLMSKPTLVTLPMLLLLLDYWPLHRIFRPAESGGGHESPAQELVPRPVLLEKIPLLLLSVISSVVTLWAQQEAMMDQARLPLIFRFCNAAISYCRYIRNTLLPTKLVIDYPYPKIFSVGEIAVAAVALGYGTFWILRRAKKFRYLFTGWFWFLGALVPMIGIVQVGYQSMADRYTYIPSIGLFIIVVWGGYELAMRRGLPEWPMFTAAGAAVIVCIPFSVAQINCWRNSQTLWEHAVRVRPDHFLAEYDLANILAQQGDLAGAQAHLERSVQIRPDSFLAQNALAEMYVHERKFADAIPHFYEAMRAYPAGATAEFHTDLARALAHAGKTQEAVAEYKLALNLNPQTAEALNNLAWILATDPDEKIRDGTAAIRLAEQAVKLTGSGDANSLATLAAAYGEAGQFEPAAATAKRARELALSAGNQKLSDQVQKMADNFQAHQPFRETPAADEAE